MNTNNRKIIDVSQTISNRCLAAALAFLFVFNAFFAESQSERPVKDDRYAGFSCLLPSIESGSYLQTESGLPKFSPAVESLTEVESITEMEDDADVDHFHLDLPSFVSFPVHHELPGKVSAGLPSLPVRLRNTVPLFILYHSWKDFLQAL